MLKLTNLYQLSGSKLEAGGSSNPTGQPFNSDLGQGSGGPPNLVGESSNTTGESSSSALRPGSDSAPSNTTGEASSSALRPGSDSAPNCVGESSNPTRQPSTPALEQESDVETDPFLDLTSIPGCTFPPNSKEMMWPGWSIITKLPWVSHPAQPDINILQNVGYSFF